MRSKAGTATRKAAQNCATSREYQSRQLAAGRCPTCGRKRHKKSKRFCIRHLRHHRKVSRDRYRLAHGIPLDAPLARSGRPRIST